MHIIEVTIDFHEVAVEVQEKLGYPSWMRKAPKNIFASTDEGRKSNWKRTVDDKGNENSYDKMSGRTI